MRMKGHLFVFAILSFLLTPAAATQQPAVPGSDWEMYRKDQAGTGYSPLSQIDTRNVANLAPAWTFSLQSDAPPAANARGRGGAGGPNSEATPIVIGGVMYAPTANRVVALESETGKEIWSYSVTGGAPSRRGVAYWPGQGAALPPRIIFTSGRRLIALDAKTGAIVPAFGTNGEVDMGIPYNSVPGIYRNVLVVAQILRRVPAAASAIHEPMTLAPAQRSGNSVRFLNPGASATTRGKEKAGKTVSASMHGRSISRWMNNADSFISHWLLQSAVITAEIERVRTCSATLSWPLMYRQARTSGTFKRSITTCGITILRRLRDCSTLCVMGARFLLSR